MMRLIAASWISGMMVLAAAESSDLLRFSNNDQLHGTFMGLKEGSQAVWQREDLTAPVDFKTSQVRHVVLRGGRPARSLSSLSHVALVNGDKVPGTITQIDDEALTLETTYAGSLRIPRGQVAMLAPSPLGGRLHYHGPFIEDEWKMANAAYPDGMPATKSDPEAKEKSDKESPGRWLFSGSAWYWPAGKRDAGSFDPAV
jgi:hypothetical protein